MRKPRKGIVERFLRHLILSRDFHTSLMLAPSVGSVTGEHEKWHISCLAPNRSLPRRPRGRGLSSPSILITRQTSNEGFFPAEAKTSWKRHEAAVKCVAVQLNVQHEPGASCYRSPSLISSRHLRNQESGLETLAHVFAPASGR